MGLCLFSVRLRLRRLYQRDIPTQLHHETKRRQVNATRRNLCKGLLAMGAMPVFNMGCAGFGESRARQLAKGSKTRIAIIGCGDWGRLWLQ